MSVDHHRAAIIAGTKHVDNTKLLLEHQVAALFNAAFEEVRATCSALITAPGNVEALHQFRISLRRVKSLLHSFKEVLRRAVYSTLNSNVSGPLSASNALRDHDVLIAALSDKAALHEKPRIAYLNALTKHLNRVRNPIRNQTLQLVVRWQLAECSGPFTRKPVRGESFVEYLQSSLTNHQEVIESCLTKVRRTQKDESVHQLRIACKHYRYLLEMSEQAVTPGMRVPKLKRLKRLQCLLGKFNDYAVWRCHLAALSPNQLSNKASYACGAFSVKCWYMQHQLLPDIRESTSHLFD